MTNVNTRIPRQHSAFAGSISSLFSVALLVMTGVLTFAIFANI
ncbi:MAG TPA: hypothetical protein VMU08_05495 [Rhizomicrobium sp.]|nr:hypothetical protein [Rhizomicrobium sp.]